MSQFDVYRNARNTAYPFLLELQADIHSSALDTRLVVPLMKRTRENVFTRLTPTVRILGRDYVAMFPMMSGIPKSMLGSHITSMANRRMDFIPALDLLVTGV